VRYRFRGLRRDTGEPVEGHVTAPTEDAAYQMLGDNAIVAESLRPDPAAPNGAAAQAKAAQIAGALDRALDEAGLRVNFDQLTRRYQGKSVWVLDRDKIRKHVAKLVDDAIVANLGDDENRQDTRRHIAQVLEKMFQDTQNLGSERSAQSVSLESEVRRLTAVVGQIERAIASMSLAARAARGGGEPRTVRADKARDKARDEVLIEIFENNLDLMRGLLETPASQPAGQNQAG
jgi:hypothetical protein